MMTDEDSNLVLCVGLNCLDIVSECDNFPVEDDKIGTTTVHNRLASSLCN